MNLILNWANVEQFVDNVTNPFPLARFKVRQDSLGEVIVQAAASGAAKDLAAYSIEVAIQGGTGKPTGTEGDAVYAAYTAPGGFTWDAIEMRFVGKLDTRTAEMAALIGPAEAHQTVIAVKITALDGSFTDQWQAPCDVLAPVIESGIQSPLGAGPTAFVITGGQAQATFAFPNLEGDALLQFIKQSSGPAVDVYAVNVNPDHPELNTVTVTLAGVALGDMNFAAYAVRA